tara:strand:- start:1527 stop:1976 length:450 start_codon:yes stop_codon:yes gene_type:complete
VRRQFEKKKKKKKKKKGPPKRARGRNFGGVDATTTRRKKRTDTNIIDIIKIADVRARVFHRQKTLRAERTDDEGRGKDVEEERTGGGRFCARISRREARREESGDHASSAFVGYWVYVWSSAKRRYFVGGCDYLDRLRDGRGHRICHGR